MLHYVNQAWASSHVPGVTAPCWSPASSVLLQVFLHFFHPHETGCQDPPLQLPVCATLSFFTSLGLSFFTCLMEPLCHPACSTCRELKTGNSGENEMVKTTAMVS